MCHTKCGQMLANVWPTKYAVFLRNRKPPFIQQNREQNKVCHTTILIFNDVNVVHGEKRIKSSCYLTPQMQTLALAPIVHATWASLSLAVLHLCICVPLGSHDVIPSNGMLLTFSIIHSLLPNFEPILPIPIKDLFPYGGYWIREVIVFSLILICVRRITLCNTPHTILKFPNADSKILKSL